MIKSSNDNSNLYRVMRNIGSDRFVVGTVIEKNGNFYVNTVDDYDIFPYKVGDTITINDDFNIEDTYLYLKPTDVWDVPNNINSSTIKSEYLNTYKPCIGRIFDKDNPNKAIDVSRRMEYPEVSEWINKRIRELVDLGYNNLDYEIFNSHKEKNMKQIKSSTFTQRDSSEYNYLFPERNKKPRPRNNYEPFDEKNGIVSMPGPNGENINLEIRNGYLEGFSYGDESMIPFLYASKELRDYLREYLKDNDIIVPLGKEDFVQSSKQIKSGIDSIKNRNNILVIPDREQAIKKAVEISKENDIILIAGKGHEDYQIIGTTKIHFSDKEIVLKYK